MVLVSRQGIEEVEQRRIQKGWNRKSANFGVAAATMGRFWSGRTHLKKDTLHTIFMAVGMTEWQQYLISAETIDPPAIEPPPIAPAPIAPPAIESPPIEPDRSFELPMKIWDGVPDYPTFYGREKDIQLLKRRVLQDRYRIVALLGFGGIGKTALAARFVKELPQLAEQSQPPFDGVIWRSLRSAPPLDEFLIDLLETITGQFVEPKSPNRLLKELTNCLNQSRFLLVFDGWEELLGGEYGGFYQPAYQAYGDLFLETLGQRTHQSSILITSREKQAKLTLIGPGIYSMPLPKLDWTDAVQILNNKGLHYLDPAAAERLVARYDSNPLALQLVASKIRDQFDGDVSRFLSQDTILNDELFIRTVLEQQTRHLNPAEWQMLRILAQDPTPIDRYDLGVRFAEQPSLPASVSNILASLERRSLVERLSETGQVLYTLQPLVRQYVITMTD